MPKRWNLRLISLLTLTRSGPLTMMCTDATIFDSDSDQTWRSVHSNKSEQPDDADRSWQVRTVHIEHARDGRNARSQTVERNRGRHALEEYKGSRLDCRGEHNCVSLLYIDCTRTRRDPTEWQCARENCGQWQKDSATILFTRRGSEQHALIIVMTSETAGSKYIFHQ